MVRRAAVPHILSLSFLRPRQVGVSGVRGDGVGRGPGMAAGRQGSSYASIERTQGHGRQNTLPTAPSVCGRKPSCASSRRAEERRSPAAGCNWAGRGGVPGGGVVR